MRPGSTDHAITRCSTTSAMRWRVSRIVGVALLLLSLSWVGVRAQPGDGPPPALVRVGQVKEQTLQRRWDLIGRLKEVNRVIVSAEQEGRLVAVKIEVGQPVVGGQTVLAAVEDSFAKLELASTQAALAQAEATVLETEALLDNATRDREFYEGLAKAGTAKRKELDDARTTERAVSARLKAAKAQVVAAQVRVDHAKTDLAKLAVVAPFDGVVVRKLAELGMWAQKGTPVAEMISRGRIDAVVDVPEKFVNQVEDGQPVEVVIEPLGQTVQGKVQAVIPSANLSARTFPIKVRMDDLGGRLKSGMSAIAKLPAGPPLAMMTVPRDAVLRSAQGLSVWVNANGVAAKVPIKVLFSENNRYAIEPLTAQGLQSIVDGAEVVIEGGERILFPGQPLKVTRLTQKSNPSAPNQTAVDEDG